MEAFRGERFGRDRRIRKSAEFGFILRNGVRGSSSLLSVALVPAAAGAGRIGISASTRVGGSVERNRARRMVREYYRQAFKSTAAYDIVFNLKPGFAELKTTGARAALDDVLSRTIAGGEASGRLPRPRR